MTDSFEPEPLTIDTVVQSMRTALFENPDASFMLDKEGRVLAVNPALCVALHRDEASLMGTLLHLAVGAADPHRFRAKFLDALSGKGSRYRGKGVDPTGRPFVAEITQIPVRIEGRVVAVMGSALDLTDRERQEEQLETSEELLRFAGRVARFGGWSVDAATNTLSLSEGARALLGIAEDEPDLTSAVWHRHSEESKIRAAAAMQKCLTAATPFDFESVVATPDGESATIRTIGEADVLADGTISGAHGALWDISDITASREREQGLESRLSATLNAITDGLFFIDSDGLVSFANSRAVDIMGVSGVELAATPFWDLLPHMESAGFRTSFEHAKATGARTLHRALFTPNDRWFETISYPTDDGLAVYLRDVTDEQKASEVTRQTHLQLQQQAALLDTARDAMIVRDLDNRVQFWNRAATELYGWTADEVAGKWIGDLMYIDVSVLERATEAVLREGVFTDEVEQRTKDGHTVLVDCRWQLISDDQGRPTAIFAVNTDITAYRREQDARLRAQRMEALGTLAGGIAHDLNNVLTPILMSIQLLDADETDPARQELLHTMETAVTRGADMIQQVLAFARGMEGRRIFVDINQLLDDLVRFTRDVLPTGVAIEIDRAARLPSTVGDPTQLLQVLINLVTNAKDAMTEGGHLRITAEQLEITDDYTSVSHAAEPGEYLVISVEDDGYGMPADMSAKIFEPFFTTKDPGKGTGLGLATSLAIVRSHAGFMQVYSEPGRGTRVIVGLRSHASPSTETSESAPVTTLTLPSGSGQLVLVIDDEHTIRQVASKTLEAYGYHTVVASNGREAIDLIESGDVTIDLVITDMMMPVMGGAATSAYLEEHHPSVPIVAASGLNAGDLSRGSAGMGISRFLAKPYTTTQLLTTVRDALSEHRTGDEGSR
jgi:two-component system cell cycle sensor histidine kinase/response regulator CckA